MKYYVYHKIYSRPLFWTRYDDGWGWYNAPVNWYGSKKAAENVLEDIKKTLRADLRDKAFVISNEELNIMEIIT